jgi:hypothetical protein
MRRNSREDTFNVHLYLGDSLEEKQISKTQTTPPKRKREREKKIEREVRKENGR